MAWLSKARKGKERQGKARKGKGSSEHISYSLTGNKSRRKTK